MQSPDQDFRYVFRTRSLRFFVQAYGFDDRFMGLNDLMTEIKQDPTCFLGDEPVENKVLNQVLALVEDKISEVKNQAVKWCVEVLISS
jgi:cullin-associated NEDD8-dissociated protein 1